METELLALLMFAALFVGVLTGFPIAFVLGGLGLIFGFFGWGPPVIDQIVSRTYWVMNNDTFPAVPLFVFMGCVLERSGFIDKLFEDMRLAMGPLRGSLAIATNVVATIFAAATGIVGAPVTVLGLVALPPMLKHGYDKALATGVILAGGTLGILIPPSIMLIIYAPMAQLSIAKMFAAAFLPGFLLSGLYLTYIIIRCYLQPHLGPSLPKEERMISPLRLLGRLSVSLLPTALLVLAVLGSILLGVAAPTEAAAVGATMGLLLGLAYRRLTWQNFKESVYTTLRVSSMILIIAVGASIFTGVFMRLGGGRMIEEVLLGLPLGPIGITIIVMGAIFIMGMFLDWVGILLVFVPVLSPVIITLGFDPLWFAMVICVTLQTSFLTPPFAVSIFYLKGVAPPEVKITDIYKGVIPFISLQLTGLALCIIFPQIILWLPGLLYA